MASPTNVKGEIFKIPIRELIAEDAAFYVKLTMVGVGGNKQVQAEIAATPGLGQGGVLIRFEAICCDDLYGQCSDFRAEMNGANYDYMADVPQNTQVYLKRPVAGVPEAQSGRHGRKPFRYRVLSADKSLKVSDVACLEDKNWRCIRVRDTERGELYDEFAARRVWTIHDDKPIHEGLVMQCEGGGKCMY